MYKRGGSLIDATKNSIWYDDNMYVINHVYIYDQTRKRYLIHIFFDDQWKKLRDPAISLGQLTIEQSVGLFFSFEDESISMNKGGKIMIDQPSGWYESHHK